MKISHVPNGLRLHIGKKRYEWSGTEEQLSRVVGALHGKVHRKMKQDHDSPFIGKVYCSVKVRGIRAQEV